MCLVIENTAATALYSSRLGTLQETPSVEPPSAEPPCRSLGTASMLSPNTWDTEGRPSHVTEEETESQTAQEVAHCDTVS